MATAIEALYKAMIGADKNTLEKLTADALTIKLVGKTAIVGHIFSSQILNKEIRIR